MTVTRADFYKRLVADAYAAESDDPMTFLALMLNARWRLEDMTPMHPGDLDQRYSTNSMTAADLGLDPHR